MLHRIIYLIHVVSLAASIGLLTGCAVPIPLISSSSLPEVTSHLPPDLRVSDVQTLVLAETTRTKPGTVFKPAIINAPIFAQGKELALLGEFLRLKYYSGVAVLVVGPWGPVGGGVVVESTEILNRLCVLVADGRSIMFVPRFTPRSEGSWTDARQGVLSTSRRDAIIAALRAGGKSPFAEVDGPCGLYGEVEWSDKERAQIVAFMERVSPRELPRESKPVPRMFSSTEFGGDAADGAVLVATFSWRGQVADKVFLFLTIDDFDAMHKLVLATEGAEIAKLLPSHKLDRWDTENVSIEWFCGMSLAGDVRWWSKEEKTWRSLDSRPPYRDWKEDLMGAWRQGSSGAAGKDWNVGCTPHDSLSWSEHEKLRIVSFLERMPSQERPTRRTFAELLSVQDSTVASSGSTADIMALWTSQRGLVVPPVFLRVKNLDLLIEVIVSMKAEELTAALSELWPGGFSEARGSIKVCLIGVNGRIVELQSSGATTWGKPKRSVATVEWRQEAINAARGAWNIARATNVCGLNAAENWHREVRETAIGFLEKLQE